MIAWRWLLAASAAAIALGVAAGEPLQSALTMAVAIGGVCGAAVGVRRWCPAWPGPWLRFVAAGASFLAGYLVRGIHGAVVGASMPFPSPADAFFLLGYVLILSGQIVLARRRAVEVEGDSYLDALIVAVSVCAFTWAYVLLPYLGEAGPSGGAKALSVVYSVGDAAMIVVVARLAVGHGRLPVTYYLLAGSLAGLVTTDLLSILQTVGEGPEALLPVFSALSFALFGAAGLHPSMAQISEPGEPGAEIRTQSRLVLLSVAILMIPTLLLVQLVSPRDFNPVFLTLGALVVSGLVLVRLVNLVRTKERKAETERSLREASGALVAAIAPQEIYRGALEGALALASKAGAVRVAVAAGSGNTLMIMATAAPREYRTVSRALTLTALPPTARVALREVWSDPVELRAPVEGLSSGEGGERTTMVALGSGDRPLGALFLVTKSPVDLATARATQFLANQTSLALRSAALAEEFHRRQQERRYRILAEHSSDLVAVIDGEGVVELVGSIVAEILGLTEEEIVGRPLLRQVHIEDRHRARAMIERARETGRAVDGVEVRMHRADGLWRWFELEAQNPSEPDREGHDDLILQARDVTERKQAEDLLAESEARFRSLVQNSSDLVLVIGASDLCVSYLSPSAVRLLGYSSSDLQERSILELMRPEAVSYFTRSLDHLAPLETRTLDLRLQCSNGAWLALEVTISDQRDDSAVAGFVLNARDVSERKALERNLRHQALHDGLTALPNRVMFSQRLRVALAALARRPDDVAVLFIDLDDFKTVNDGLGHSVGDALLQEVALRLRSCLRERDLAARLGGDEFAVLLAGVADAAQAISVADRVLATLAQPFRIGPEGMLVDIGASIGVVLGAQCPQGADDMLGSADLAMYMAKTLGKGRYQLFEPGMHDDVSQRLRIKGDLARGVEHDEFHLVYQPVVNMITGACLSLEALVRWNHPTRGQIGPESFLDIAEDSGLIAAIGQQTLGEAAGHLRRWRQRGRLADLEMSFNLSHTELMHPALPARLDRTFGLFEVDPAWFTLEISEKLIAADQSSLRQRLRDLKSLGVSLAVDDFGTGQWSLGHLQDPVDVLKLDRCLVQPLGEREQQTEVVQVVVELAHAHGLRAVAEGVERQDQAAVLRELGCDAAQGHLFGKPVDHREVERALRAARLDLPA